MYLSVFSMLVVLFFSATGVTLNHPEWTFGIKPRSHEVRGTLPAGWRTAKGVDWLRVAEYLRATHRLHGTVTDRRDEGSEGALTFKAPGYSADCVFDLESGKYEVAIDAQGFVGVMNDLHRGRDSGKTWAVLIDVSGYALCLVSITGIALLLYLKKMRVSGLAATVAGCLVLLYLMRLAA